MSNVYSVRPFIIVKEDTDEPLVIQHGNIIITKIVISAKTPNNNGYYIWGDFKKPYGVRVDLDSFPFILGGEGEINGDFSVCESAIIYPDNTVTITSNDGTKYRIKEMP